MNATVLQSFEIPKLDFVQRSEFLMRKTSHKAFLPEGTTQFVSPPSYLFKAKCGSQVHFHDIRDLAFSCKGIAFFYPPPEGSFLFDFQYYLEVTKGLQISQITHFCVCSVWSVCKYHNPKLCKIRAALNNSHWFVYWSK